MYKMRDERVEGTWLDDNTIAGHFMNNSVKYFSSEGSEDQSLELDLIDHISTGVLHSTVWDILWSQAIPHSKDLPQYSHVRIWIMYPYVPEQVPTLVYSILYSRMKWGKPMILLLSDLLFQVLAKFSRLHSDYLFYGCDKEHIELNDKTIIDLKWKQEIRTGT